MTTETLVSSVVAEDKPEAVTVVVAAPKAAVEVVKKVKEETVEVVEKKETLVPDALEVADMTGMYLVLLQIPIEIMYTSKNTVKPTLIYLPHTFYV